LPLAAQRATPRIELRATAQAGGVGFGPETFDVAPSRHVAR
jgi:hypothetical protein